jgi:hypothetical protein
MPSGDTDLLRIKTPMIPRPRLSHPTRHIPHFVDNSVLPRIGGVRLVGM